VPSKKSTPDNAAAMEAARIRLADAEALEASRRQQLDTWTEKMLELEERLEEGDDSVTVQDQRDASDEAERAGTLHAAAVAAVEAARRAIPNTDTSLAAAVSTAISNALGVPVTVTTTKPEAPEAKALPAAFVTQTRPSQSDTIEGIIRGAVDVTYYRTRLHVPASTEAIERAAEAARISVDIKDLGTAEDASGVVVDVLRIDARAALPIPVIAFNGQDAFRIDRFASAVAGHVADSMQSPTAPSVGVRMDVSGNASQQAASVRVVAGKPSVQSDETDTNGVRRRSVAVTLTATPAKGSAYVEPPDFRACLERAVTVQKDTHAPGLGRVTEATSLGFEPAAVWSGRGVGGVVDARFVFVSQTHPGAPIGTLQP
jgi:hypothetical protein